MSKWIEIEKGKRINEDDPTKIFLNDLNYLKAGQRYVVRHGTYLYNYECPIEEVRVLEFSPDKKYIKWERNGLARWEPTQPDPGYFILSEL